MKKWKAKIDGLGVQEEVMGLERWEMKSYLLLALLLLSL